MKADTTISIILIKDMEYNQMSGLNIEYVFVL